MDENLVDLMVVSKALKMVVWMVLTRVVLMVEKMELM